MMRKHRYINTIITIIIVAMTLTCNIQEIYAIGCGGGWVPVNGSISGGSGGGCPGSGKHHIECHEKIVATEEEILLREDLYDTDGNYIGAAATLQNEIALVGGRYVGIDAYEEYKKTYYATISPSCTDETAVYVCWPEQCTCSGQTQYRTSCGWVSYCSTCQLNDDDWRYCRKKAYNLIQKQMEKEDLKESYVATRQDVNDINKGVSGNTPTINVALSSEDYIYGEIAPSEKENLKSKNLSRTLTIRHRYNLTSSWIDPITGKVSYEPNCGSNSTNVSYNSCVTEEKKENYIQVPRIKETTTNQYIGQYFVPLNAKSTDRLRYYLDPNMNKSPVSAKLCEAIIKKYNVKKRGVEFWGDFITTINGTVLYDLVKTSDAAIKRVNADGGCRLRLHVEFRIEQEYYNENNNTLKGYNFYYRPIDYSKPFPNGIAIDGYWYGRYDQKTNATSVKNTKGEKDKYNSQDLDTSFDKVTYHTNGDYDENAIRKYNTKEIYSSWGSMYKSGTSTFINGNNGVSREGCQSFYSLGCGPDNDNWAQCKVTEVCH